MLRRILLKLGCIFRIHFHATIIRGTSRRGVNNATLRCDNCKAVFNDTWNDTGVTNG